MAGHEDSLPVQAIKLAQKIATGQHVLSRVVPLALLVLDAALCVVIIKKVPCKCPRQHCKRVESALTFYFRH